MHQVALPGTICNQAECASIINLSNARSDVFRQFFYFNVQRPMQCFRHFLFYFGTPKPLVERPYICSIFLGQESQKPSLSEHNICNSLTQKLKKVTYEK